MTGPHLGAAPEPPPPHGLLADRVAVVTAAAGTGIGSAVAERMLAEGARVVVSDRHAARLGAAVDGLAATYGDRVTGVVADVTSEAAVRALLDAAVDRWGTLDVLVNNAGLGGTHSIRQTDDDVWQRILDVTLTGTFRCVRAAFDVFAALGRGGVIVNNASVSGWRAQEGQAAYAAAKAGVMALTRCAAVEGVPLGVRVNAVAPSLADHANLAKAAPAELLAELAGRELYGRSARTWEVAAVVVFLASDYSSYLSGEVLAVSSQHP